MKRNLDDFNIPAEETMYIIKAPCWKCHNEMNVAVIRGDVDKRRSSTSGPESFSEKEMLLAQKYDVVIKKHYSVTMDENYYANTCPTCESFIGRFYLFLDYYNPAELGGYQYQQLKLE